MELGASNTASVMAPPCVTYSSEQIKAMEISALNQCLCEQAIDKNTIRLCLKDPRADVRTAFRTRMENGDRLAVDTFADLLYHSGDIENLRNGFWDAALVQNVEIVRYMIDRFESELLTLVPATAWVAASDPANPQNEHLSCEIIAFLINKQLLNVNEIFSNGSTLLHFAGLTKQYELIKCLLDLNANPFIRDTAGHLAYADTHPRRFIEIMEDYAERNKLEDPRIVWTYFDKGKLETLSMRGFKPQFPTDLDIKKTSILVRLHQNSDLHFIRLINVVSSLLGLQNDLLVIIHQFLSRTFLEQSGVETRLKFREPSYNALLRLQRVQPQRAEIPSIMPKPEQQRIETEHVPKSAETEYIKSEQKSAEDCKDISSPDIVSVVFPYFQSVPWDDFESMRDGWGDDALDSSPQAKSSEYEPRTLDESYYTGLNYKQLSQRNGDQIVSRFGNSRSGENPILLVPQLWLLKIDNFVVTAFERSKLRGLPPSLSMVRQIGNNNPRIGENISSQKLTAMMLSTCVSYLDRPNSAGLEDPIFFVFEKGVANLFDDVQTYMKALSMDNIHVEKEKLFIHEINDIRDELAMISNVIDQQQEVWNAFYKDSEAEIEEWAASDPDIFQCAIRPKELIPKFQRRIAKIDKDAERVKESILTLLDLKAKHAALQESRNSSNLNIAVIGFTIITVIFTPLSFLSSLFALPIDKFQTQQVVVGGSSTYSSGYIGTWMAVGEIVSLVVTVGLVGLSFYLYKMQQKTQEKKQEARERHLANGDQPSNKRERFIKGLGVHKPKNQKKLNDKEKDESTALASGIGVIKGSSKNTEAGSGKVKPNALTMTMRRLFTKNGKIADPER